MTRRPQRPGTSLLEVLVGLGIMAVGAISAFVLFPLSTINVGRALVDDRTTTCAITADGQLRDIHRQYVVNAEVNGVKSNEPYFLALDPVATATNTADMIANDAGPGLPVFLDPMGYVARSGNSQTAVGDTGETQIPRRTLSFISNNTHALRFCSQMDGLSFNEEGAAFAANQSELRELRYNWLWVLQRPVNRDRLTVRMQVVVFDKRAHLYAPPGSESRVTATAGFTPGGTQITNVPQTAEVRKGTWVMDAGNVAGGLRHAEFYRVVSVTEATVAGNATYTLEVHKPITRPDGGTAGYQASLVVMPGVAEVFERPALTGSPAP